ncbi:MAG: electron transport complex subunit RsxD [Gammaproteobacteria bacterium]|nr:MAG: electron transport complex subunit RsxD [Gammaproteobacteria bacterium]
MQTSSSPHLHSAAPVSSVMLRVIYALIPGVIATIWFFGWGVAVNVMLAAIVALASEAVMLAARGRPIKPFLLDGSALVTAFLLALSLPPLAPWWITLIGTAFAIVVAKQLYGGLGCNPFNPAMAGYVVLLISFPREMTQWLAPETVSGHALSFAQAAQVIFSGAAPPGLTLDAVSAATPLDTLKTHLHLGETVEAARRASPVFGSLGGLGWEWINGLFLAGGLWMMYKKVITWHIPVALLGGLLVMSTAFHLFNGDAYVSPAFHLFSGAAMLGAFFIATDPVSACTTPRGKLYYGAGIGILTYIIRAWGGYPDGIAFAVLLMNMAAPLIDHYTQPRVFGHKK